MRKVFFMFSLAALTLTSCGAKKKIAELEKQNKDCQDLLNSTTVKLNLCLTEKEALNQQNDYLKKNNSDLISTSKDMTVISTKGAQNIEKALETIKEKDLKIGDHILIERSGDVIPQIVKSLSELRNGEEKEIDFPKNCQK